MRSKVRMAFVALLICVIALLPLSFAYAAEDEDEAPKIRGIYIYDERDFLPQDSEVALAWVLWNLDLKSGYEMVLVFPKKQLSETEIIEWFNTNKIGKKKRDNGAALFVFPDNSMFMAIGSGNDKITVTKSKTYGERIFADFEDDPVLTLLRFVSKMAEDVDKSTAGGKLSDFGATVWKNIDVVLLWALVLALILFLIQQYNGFQPRDLILPIAVFVVAMIFVGFAQLGGGSEPSSYTSYGVITLARHSSYTRVHMHQICTSTGKITTCRSYPHIHDVYVNNVTLLSYELNKYQYQFKSEESKWAWNRNIGEIERIKIGIEKGEIRDANPASLGKDSGGITKGDGAWIHAAKKK